MGGVDGPSLEGEGADLELLLGRVRGEHGGAAAQAARLWAASRHPMRPRELRELWPWLVERWTGRIRDWEQVNAIP